MRCISAWDIKPGMIVVRMGHTGVVKDVQRKAVHGVLLYRLVYTNGRTENVHPAAAVWIETEED